MSADQGDNGARGERERGGRLGKEREGREKEEGGWGKRKGGYIGGE